MDNKSTNKDESSGDMEKDDRTPENGTELPERPAGDKPSSTSLEAAQKEFQKELLYMRAEFDNVKKRLLREQEQAMKMANEKLVAELVNPIDLLERAVAASKPLKSKGLDPDVMNFITGVELTHREFIQLLGRFGVEFIGTPGEKFDPVRHEAIAQQETSEEKRDTVLEVLQKGCVFQGRLTKPAKVVVGRGPSQ